MCQNHYVQWWRERPDAPICEVRKCDRKSYVKGMCGLHYSRMKRHGDPHKKVRTKPERLMSKTGYILITKPEHPAATSDRVLEHRLIMEERLGRYLLPGENVHHINGVRHDNRPENLELWVTSQPSGQRPADLVAWAREIIDRYGAADHG